jgi:UrcA family protein
MRLLLSLSATAAAVLLVPHAATARDYEVRQIRVNASALDLSAPAGMDELARRIHRAVNRICGSDRDCKDEAWASTEEQVAWAIGRDVWMRRMAEERMAQHDACRGRDCDLPEPAYYPAPPPMPAPAGGVIVVIVHNAAPPPIY